MRIQSYLIYLLSFLLAVTVIVTGLGFLRLKMHREVVAISTELRSAKDKQASFEARARLLESVNKESPILVQYKNAWVSRRRNYDSAEKVKDLLRAGMESHALVPPEMTDGNQVKDGPDGAALISWRVLGTPARVLSWLGEAEEKIDFLRVTETALTIRDDGSADAIAATITATVKLP